MTLPKNQVTPPSFIFQSARGKGTEARTTVSSEAKSSDAYGQSEGCSKSSYTVAGHEDGVS